MKCGNETSFSCRSRLLHWKQEKLHRFLESPRDTSKSRLKRKIEGDAPTKKKIMLHHHLLHAEDVSLKNGEAQQAEWSMSPGGKTWL